MSVFEERLWQELVRDHSHELLQSVLVEPPRQRRQAPALAALAAIAAAIVALLLWVGGGASQPAYGVTQHPDGTITVMLRRLVGVQGADARLAQLGVPVRMVAIEAGCKVRPGQFKVVRLAPRAVERIRRVVGPGAASLKVQPSAIPQGDTLLLAATAAGPGVIDVNEALYRGATPPCLPLRADASR